MGRGAGADDAAVIQRADGAVVVDAGDTAADGAAVAQRAQAAAGSNTGQATGNGAGRRNGKVAAGPNVGAGGRAADLRHCRVRHDSQGRRQGERQGLLFGTMVDVLFHSGKPSVVAVGWLFAVHPRWSGATLPFSKLVRYCACINSRKRHTFFEMFHAERNICISVQPGRPRDTARNVVCHTFPAFIVCPQ